MEDGVQLGISGADDDCNVLSVGGRRANYKTPKPVRKGEEMACARRFCLVVAPELTDFVEMAEYSATDILAGSADKKHSRKLQVTSVWPCDFWGSLANGAADKLIPFEEFVQLLSVAIQKKRLKAGPDVTLLLDTHPVTIGTRCLNKLKANQPVLQGVADQCRIFAEIWLVDQNECVQISWLQASQPSITRVPWPRH